jgi:hypothetical protein
LVALAAMVGLAWIVYGLLWWATKDIFKGTNFLEGWDGDLGLSPEPFPATGRMPMSSALEGSFVRWHDPEFFWSRDAFWKTFQDGDWKWDKQERYAGKGLNCGHYFALNREGATAEGKFYNIPFSKRALLTVEGKFDAVLDLTYEAHLVAVGREAFENFDDLPPRAPLMTLLSYLVGHEKGGNAFRDFVGYWAHREGYDGILFFGARALESDPRLLWQIHHGQDEDMTGTYAHGYFTDMRRRPDLKNLVIFSGAKLTTRVSSYQLPPGERTTNSLHDMPAGEFDRKLDFNAEYQAERANRGFYLAKPPRYG